MMRKEFIVQHFGLLAKIWGFSMLVALCILLIRNTTDPGMIVLSIAIGFVFICITCEKLNSLSKVSDARFMLHSIFWLGFAGFGLMTLMVSYYYSILASLFCHGIFNAITLSAMIFYHTGKQTRYQKTLE